MTADKGQELQQRIMDEAPSWTVTEDVVLAGSERVDRRALAAFIEYADGLRSTVDGEFLAGRAEHEASDKEFSQHVAALGVPTEPGSDALLASVMRKLLASNGYSNWGGPPWEGFWVTVDVHAVTITAEELQAIDDAAPAS